MKTRSLSNPTLESELTPAVYPRTSLVLREYQTEAISAIWSEICRSSNALCSLSTGSGKTVIISEFIRRAITAKPDISIIILINNVNLINQTAEVLRSYGHTVSIYCASANEKILSQITVASVRSIDRIDVGLVHLAIIDEVHNYNHADGVYLEIIKKMQAANPRFKVVGFSATPFRSNGYIFGEGKLFSRVTYHKPIDYMIENGYLVRPVMKSVDEQVDTSTLSIVAGDYSQRDLDRVCNNKNKIARQLDDALPRLVGRRSIIWFCTSIEHAETLNEALGERGEVSCTVHSKQTVDQRAASFEAFKAGVIRHCTFVTVIKEGIDIPRIDAVCLMRPTRSANLYIQVLGRGLRPFDGKENCLVLDYGSVIAELGPVNNPRLHFTEPTNKRRAKCESLKVCPKCYSYVPSMMKHCPDCTFEFPREIRIEKLSHHAQSGSVIGPPKKSIDPVSGVKLSKYKSKAGNDCLKITYQTGSTFFSDGVSEFFILTNDYSYRRFQSRAVELALPIVGALERQIMEQPKRIPVAIEYVTVKYPEIKKLYFEGDLIK